MLITAFSADSAPPPVPGYRRLRKYFAGIAAGLVMGCSFYVGVVNGMHEFKLVFRDAPREILPAAVAAQIEQVERIVPKGSFLLYVMDEPEAWRFGLWKRSLYPQYTILPVVGSKVLNAPWVKAFRDRHDVRYLILAGSSIPTTGKKFILPEYPAGTTTTLVEVSD